MSTFICTRADLLSGNVGKILNLRPIEAFFVDRIVLNGILSSARTVWGEDLLPQVPRLPIRKLDIYKSLFNSLNVMTMCIIGYPFLPEATKYAMGAPKHTLHSCYYSHHL